MRFRTNLRIRERRICDFERMCVAGRTNYDFERICVAERAEHAISHTEGGSGQRFPRILQVFLSWESRSGISTLPVFQFSGPAAWQS